jgi:hypothetical protein
VYAALNRPIGDLARQGWIALDAAADTVDATAARRG